MLAGALKFLVVSIAIVALYFQDLVLVFRGALTNESTSYILAIPLLFALLLFLKRNPIQAVLKQAETEALGLQKHANLILGVALCTVAVSVYWYGNYALGAALGYHMFTYHMLTLPIMATGLILILFNIHLLKQLIFPIAFLFFLTPPPGLVFNVLGSRLAYLSASASNTLANIFGMHTVFSSTSGTYMITLTRPDNTILPFNVDLACSGIDSLVGFAIFTLFIAYLTRGRLRNKLVMLTIGIPLFVALNILRVTTILAIGYHFGDELALQVFHNVGATVLMFLGTFLLLAITTKVFKEPKTQKPSPNSIHPVLNPAFSQSGPVAKTFPLKLNKNGWVKAVCVILVVIVLLSIQVPVFALTQGPPQVLVQTSDGVQIDPLLALLPNVAGYELDYVNRNTVYEQKTGEDASLMYSYSSFNQTQQQMVWVSIDIADSPSSIHDWEYCLASLPSSFGNDPTVNQLGLRDIQIRANPPITARLFAYQNKVTNQTQVVLYWYTFVDFNVDNLTRTKCVKVSLIIYPSSVQGVSEAESQLMPLAVAIDNYWVPIQFWNPVALFLGQNGLFLSVAAVAFLVFLLAYLAYLNRNKFASLKKRSSQTTTAPLRHGSDLA